jgi:hypothetical protein
MLYAAIAAVSSTISVASKRAASSAKSAGGTFTSRVIAAA